MIEIRQNFKKADHSVAFSSNFHLSHTDYLHQLFPFSPSPINSHCNSNNNFVTTKIPAGMVTARLGHK
uniref:Uncharacterized protein n=1 Tax=Rhizophora mucronata TaxID=61149 RepID=A0A2P2NYL9_RHIMU